MNILILSSKIPYPLKDGGAIATYNLMAGLSDIGHKINLLTFNTKKHYLKPEDFPKDKISSESIHTIYTDTSPKIISALKNLLFSTKPYIQTRFYNTGFKNKLEYLLQSKTFDIIQIEGLYLLQYIPFIRTKSTALISYRAHNIEHKIWSNLSKNEPNILLNLYLNNMSKRIKKYEQTIINEYDLLIPISNDDVRFFKNLGNHKPIHVSPVGFEGSSHNNITDNKAGKHIYFIGSLDWLPNQEAIIWFIENCWVDFKKQNPDTKFFIAGRNAPAHFKKRIKYHDIIYEGEIEDVSEFIKDKKIMIVPLLSGSGMRVKIIEAFIHGKAVVSTKLGAIGTKSIDNEHLLIAETANEFVEKIGFLLHNETVYKKIIANAHNLVSENFDIFEISKSLAQFYSSYISE
ncbi:MAG: hypothetical protein DRI95_10075 [Bacteroidetes bacterium]|nr:MAG: hypothetical protein DRI95_10075 [Bacteroidota bacterium]